MRLNLALHGILVASAAIDEAKCKDEFYLQAVRQQLLLQNQEIIGQIRARPFFYIEVPASSASLQFQKTGNDKTKNASSESACLSCGKACNKAGAGNYLSAG